MTELYPVGSSIPVQPWLIESIQQDLGHKREAVRRHAAYRQYLVQRFGAWRVLPVRVGRWERTSFWDEYGDSWLLLLAPVLLPWRPGLWKAEYRYVQVLDPASGAPIAELDVSGWSHGGHLEDAWRMTREVAILGDPRVGGLVAPVDASSMEQVYTGHRRGRDVPYEPERFEQVAAQLVNEPYRDFADRDDGPWLADHPEKPQGNTNGWKPSRWYRPQG
jgi:hypothetical protein